MSKVTVGLIDDHSIVRQGIREILERLGGYKVIVEFESGEAFLDAYPLTPSPDVLLLDYSMKRLDGLEIIRQLARQESDLKVVLLTQHLEESAIAEAFYFGARGFLTKNCTASELKTAIDNVVTIGYVDSVAAMRYMRAYKTRSKEPSIILSVREAKFLTLVCDPAELTYDQIADRMGVSVKSVEAYRASLFDKYDIRSKTGLVMFAYRHRLVDVPNK